MTSPPFISPPASRLVEISFDGRPLMLPDGANLAAALMAAGVLRFGATADGSPRAPYCLMGTCHGCALTIDDVPQQRSCRTTVRPGLVLRTSP
ncbi:2Fe-2S iron-sulfur cluster-binding protein [Telmatospirillum siberiense]|nr:2Fe-2S iron-sulfur cluster-binding protein [Telmatospirillum siberiense]